MTTTVSTYCATTALLTSDIFTGDCRSLWKSNASLRDHLNGHSGLMDLIAEMAVCLEDTVVAVQAKLPAGVYLWEELDWYRTSEEISAQLALSFEDQIKRNNPPKPAEVVKRALLERVDDLSEGEDEYTAAMDALQHYLRGGELVPDRRWFCEGRLTASLGFRIERDGSVVQAREFEKGFWSVYRHDSEGLAEWIADFGDRDVATLFINAIRGVSDV